MKKMPENIKKSVKEFIIGVNELFGDRVKKLYYMVLMLEEILIKVQI